jgi:hypothetical protein
MRGSVRAPDVAFEIAQHAFASMTDRLWRGNPAVMFEVVWPGSLRMSLRTEETLRGDRLERPNATTTFIRRSSPVTMFPTDRRAGTAPR